MCGEVYAPFFLLFFFLFSLSLFLAPLGVSRAPLTAQRERESVRARWRGETRLPTCQPVNSGSLGEPNNTMDVAVVELQQPASSGILGEPNNTTDAAFTEHLEPASSGSLGRPTNTMARLLANAGAFVASYKRKLRRTKQYL